MMINITSIFRRKPVLIITAVTVLLAAALVTAALTGVFSGRTADSFKDAASGNMSGDVPAAGLMDRIAEVTPEDSDSLGVDTSSAFRLLFSSAADEEAVKSSLSVEPQQSFSIKKLSAKEFRVEFDRPLQPDSVYNFIFRDKDTGARKSWAFQTKKSFNVIRTLPADKSVNVPVNTGIEITFSHAGISDPEKYIEITPEVKGRFEWNKKTLVFVPDKLEQDTVYTVTVRKGIHAEGSNDTLQNDYIFKFQTEAPPTSKKYFSFANDMYNFTPDAVPSLEVYTSEDVAGSDEVVVEIYSYPDYNSFLDDIRKNHTEPYWTVDSDDDIFDLSKLQKAASVTASLVKYSDDYWNRYYLVLPSSLPEGYYVIVADIGDKYYAPLQINKTSVYIMTATNECLAWVNDTATKQPVSGAEFSLDTGVSAKTNGNGMAVLPVSLKGSDDDAHFFIIKPTGGLPFVACVPSNIYSLWNSNYNSDITDNYWTYIYLDKGMYLPQDTVNVWGIIRPRNGTVSETEAVLELVSYNWYLSDSDSASVLTSKNITLTPDGTFTGSLKISNFNPGSYEVRVKVGGKVMLSRYLTVMQYTKPVYKIDIEPDRQFVYTGETVNFNIAASFYEGTPASGMKLDYSSWISGGDEKYGTLISDSTGLSKLSVRPQTTDTGWRPVTYSLSVQNSEAEEQQVREYCNINVFPRDTMVEVETDNKNGTGTISVKTSRIDLSGLDSKSGYISPDEYRGASVDIPVTVKLYERHYEKKKTGDYYDHINKVRRDIYKYYEVQDLVQEYNFTTVGGKYEIKFAADKNKQYFAEVYAKDSMGRLVQETAYVYNWDSLDPYSSAAYKLSQNNTSRRYRTGEQVTAEVVRQNEESSDSVDGRRYLFIRMQNGVIDYTVTGSAIYTFPYESRFIPNIYVKALCFDGAGIYDAGLIQYRYDSSEKKLDIKVSPDKESYKPGEKVRLSVEVRDANGAPVSSEVNISVVDEAFFALYQQYVDTLESLYSMSVSSGFLSEYLSFEPVGELGNGMAEGGGEGGGEDVRKDFRDNALFVTVSTDAGGRAEAEFTMPDNLTSWRITCQAISSDLKAGSTIMNVSSSLPFFVDSIFNESFMTSDTPSILVRANGAELATGAGVDFKVTVKGNNGYSKSYEAKGTANLPCEVQFDALAAGNYTVRIEGSSGKLKDAVERKFTVADSLLETTVTDIIPLKEGVSLSNGVKGLTTLTFYNEDSSALYDSLRSLYCSWGSRLDQVLARKISGKLLKNYFNEDIYVNEEFDLKKYQNEDGGLALLPYDSSSPELSAKMCSLAAEGIDKSALAHYFYNLLENEDTVPEDAIYAYWGLAALKEPVLLDIRALLAQGVPDLKTRLVLGAALAEAGDYQGAYEIYKEAMESSGTVTDMMAWIETDNRDDSIEAAALCSLIAMKTNAPEKMKFFRYISSNSTSTLLVNLERMIFAVNYVKDTELVNSFTYELDGVKKHVVLEKGSCFRLVLTPEKLSSIRFSDISGNIIAARSYTAPVSEIKKTEGDIVSISRSYSIKGKEGPATTFERSDTVKINLALSFSENAPDGYYEVTDILPAGFRYIEAVYGSSRADDPWNYPFEVTGQKVVFGYYYNKNNKKQNRNIVYYAKAVSPGTYTADNAALSYTGSDIAGFSDKAHITVRANSN